MEQNRIPDEVLHFNQSEHSMSDMIERLHNFQSSYDYDKCMINLQGWQIKPLNSNFYMFDDRIQMSIGFAKNNVFVTFRATFFPNREPTFHGCDPVTSCIDIVQTKSLAKALDHFGAHYSLIVDV